MVIALLGIMPLLVTAQTAKTLLPNGWTLSPAGRTVDLGSDLPLNLALSPNGKYIAVTNNGIGTQSIQLLAAGTCKVLHTAIIAKAWLGLKFSGDSKFLFAAGGNDNRIWKYLISADTLALADSIVLGDRWPNKICPTGLDIDHKRQLLYVVTKEDNALYIVDLKTKAITKRLQLGSEAYTCTLSPDGGRLYISLWGGGKVVVVDTKRKSLTDSITVGRNPNDMAVSRNGSHLFVANSIDNSVSIVDTRTLKVVEQLNAALYPDAPQGSTTNSLALSADDKTLFIANADNNCLSVFDVGRPGHSVSKGFVPTGWYPTCVRALGKNLLVLNGKGTKSIANPNGPQPAKKDEKDNYKKANKNNDQYIGGLFKGTISIIPGPTPAQLATYSKQVYANTPYSKQRETTAMGETGNPIPTKVGAPSPIKHIFYIVKENRTYDQVLGDEPTGNGDTTLVLFGKRITPNQHAIAEQFVLLDNFYVDAEVSADGHNWSMSAYANDYVEKTWPTNYGGRGGTYDYAANKPVALPRDGFLWDYALRAGISFRDYGEFSDDDGNVYLPDLKKHMCPAYPGWDLGIKDVNREKIWEKDFDSLVAINAVPALNLVYLPSDHTAGLNKKSRTPAAFVADNDYAVGALLAHLSQSNVWNDCAVFILEDDAQNGPDHVDAHRSTAYVAGPFVKRNFVDHTMYSTTGMLRTIELILGLKPMSQYDAAATPMYKSFTLQPDNQPYLLLPETVDMDEINTALNNRIDENFELDLSAPDRIPDDILTRQLWKSVKGWVSEAPAPKRAAFIATDLANGDD